MTYDHAPGYASAAPPTRQAGTPVAPDLVGCEPSRRRNLAWALAALLPLSALIVYLVLHAMAASAAAATGGCGGG